MGKPRRPALRYHGGKWLLAAWIVSLMPAHRIYVESHGDEASPVCRCRLETGHVTLLAGEKRLWLHTVERVIRSPMFSPLGGPGRLSITIRVAGSTTTTNHQQSE